MKVSNKTPGLLKSVCWLTMPVIEFMTLFKSRNTQGDRNDDEQNFWDFFCGGVGGGVKKI